MQTKDQKENGSEEYWVNELYIQLVHSFLDFFESAIDEEDWQKIPDLVVSNFCREGWPGNEFLYDDDKKRVADSLVSTTQSLYFDRTTKNIKKVAMHVSKFMVSLIPEKILHPRENFRNDFSLMLTGSIAAEIERGGSSGAIAQRASYELYKQRQRNKKSFTKARSKDEETLRFVFGVPKKHSKVPDKQHISSILLRRRNKLSDIFVENKVFSKRILRSLLGIQLYKICRPVGFLDPSHQILLCEVDYPSMNYEVNLRRFEILEKLKKVDDFKNVVQIRCRVKTKA